MDRIYDREGQLLGRVSSGGRVEDASEQWIGKVHSAGGGEVYDGDDYRIGEVMRHGTVEDREGRRVGNVKGTRVYDSEDDLVGTVDAATETTWITGITDAHKAGAALLLLLRTPTPTTTW